MNRIGLVGANGFIGSSARAYLHPAKFEIKPIYRPDLVSSNLDFHKLISGLDQIIWSASSTNPSIAESQPNLVEEELEDWLRFLNRLSILRQPNPRLIFISSGGCVYSGSKKSFKEEDEAKGVNAYGELKSKMENVLLESGLQYSIVRASNIYGPNQPIGRGQGVIAEWINQARLGLPIHLYGETSIRRDFLYITDFLDALSRISDHHQNVTVNIGSGKSESLASVIEAISEFSPLAIRIFKLPDRGYDRPSYNLDTTLAKNTIDWKPQVDLRSGIRKCFLSERNS